MAVDRQSSIRRKGIYSLTSWANKVRIKVALGDILGRTAKEESPTSPRVTLVNAAWSTGNRNFGATELCKLTAEILRGRLTINENSISERIHGPYVGSPVSMT